MSDKLQFEFDFEEVFKGIKLGVIKQLSEMEYEDTVDNAKREAINEMKRQLSAGYSDINNMKKEIHNNSKEEIEKNIYDVLLKEIRQEYKVNYKDQFDKKISNVMDDIEEEVKDDLTDKLYNKLYSEIKNDTLSKINNSMETLLDVVTGNSVKIQNTNEILTKEDYDELVRRNDMLNALERGGVDNWEWYSDSINDYFNSDDDACDKINNKSMKTMDSSGNNDVDINSNCSEITITKKEYDELYHNSRFLYYLQTKGIDNWEGYTNPNLWNENDDD